MFEGIIREHLMEAEVVLKKFISDPDAIKNINTAASICNNSLKSGGKIISCGNGGSMSDAMHFAEELTGRFRKNRRPIAAISISDPSYITCTANDFGYNYIFSRFVEGVGKKGDVLLAISTSGNSENILNAAKVAHSSGMKIISLTGKGGGELPSIADVDIRVPHLGFSDRIQEIHIKVIHILIHLIEKGLDLD